jgi:serine O-acetyltransferase
MKSKELRILLRSDLQRLSFPNQVSTESKTKWLGFLNPRFFPVLIVRLSRYFYLSRWLRPFSHVLTWLNVIVFGIEFTPRCEVGGGLLLPHTVGTVVGALKIGNNVTIFQGVTLGAKFADIGFTPESRPVVGDNVIFGAGSKVLGGIVIGDGAAIAANSLVIENVLPGALMIGVPAVSKAIQ